MWGTHSHLSSCYENSIRNQWGVGGSGSENSGAFGSQVTWVQATIQLNVQPTQNPVHLCRKESQEHIHPQG